MSGMIFLGAQEVLPGRLFTNAEASSFDVSVLQYMVDTLRQFITQPHAVPPEPRPYVTWLEESGGRFHRLCLAQPERLQQPDDLFVVGFVGKKRPGVERGPIDAVDDQLIEEMPEHEHLLSYSTLQLESHNTVNLVLFDHADGVSHWANSRRHVQAVTMSPDYYTVIRLHNALLPGGLPGDKRLALQRTKYYDFQNGGPWRAIREFQAIAGQ